MALYFTDSAPKMSGDHYLTIALIEASQKEIDHIYNTYLNKQQKPPEGENSLSPDEAEMFFCFVGLSEGWLE